MIKLPVVGTNTVYEIAPSKIIAIGLNYREHVKESRAFDKNQLDTPPEPVLFAKTPNVLIGPEEPIVLPAFLKDYNFPNLRIDYEAELAFIIGKKCRHVAAKDALKYVYGYTCFNDISQRNIQKSDTSGWFRGKSLDTFGPIGPVIVPAANIVDPQNLAISCRVNGELKQNANTADMIFSIVTLIEFISRNFTLEEGDIVATGTPSGVGPLVHGDTVEVEIKGIGILRNPVVEEGR